MKKKTALFLIVLASLLCFSIGCMAEEEKIDEGKLYLRVSRNYSSWENPLPCEFIINGITVDLYTTDNFANIDGYIKKGWNEIAIKTTPQVPANNGNYLVFRIGPMRKSLQQDGKYVMDPVVWTFDNGTDWEFKDNQYAHALGPGVNEVTLKYHLYWDGTSYEMIPLQNGDYVLSMTQEYGSWNSPIIATVAVNGTVFSSFLGVNRQLVITPLLKPGINEVKLMTNRVTNAIKDNDIQFYIGGPAIWSVGEKKFMTKPATEFQSIQGWKRNNATGQLESIENANAEMYARTIKFMVKGLSGTAVPPLDAANPQQQASPEKSPEDEKRSI